MNDHKPETIRAVGPCIQLPAEELRLLQQSHPNVLLTGTPAATDAALDVLRSSLRPPVFTWSAGAALILPPMATPKTLIIDDAARLPYEDQIRLLAWLKQRDGATQVVTTARCCLLPLIERGMFLEALYYRLNLVYLDVA